MKQRQLPIDPNTGRPFRTVAEMRAWEILDLFISAGIRESSSNKRRKQAA